MTKVRRRQRRDDGCDDGAPGTGPSSCASSMTCQRSRRPPPVRRGLRRGDGVGAIRAVPGL